MFSFLPKQHEDVQQAFNYAFVLHPDRDVAFLVAHNGLLRTPIIRSGEDKRGSAGNPFKAKIPDCALIQTAVFRGSTQWEKVQETTKTKNETEKSPASYTPTSDDLVVRYIKLLILKTLGRNLDNVAVAFCSFLYAYSYAEICNLMSGLIGEENIRRVRARLFTEVKGRFAHLNIISSNQKAIVRRPPDLDEELIVQNTLRALAPKVPAPEKLTVFSLKHFYDYFRESPGRLSWEGNHLLISPDRAGLQRIIDLYNDELPKGSLMRLDDTKKKLLIPAFENTVQDQNNDRFARFSPPKLSSPEIQMAIQELRKDRRARKHFSSGQLRVCIEGVERTRFDSGAGESAVVRMPLFSSAIDVFAGDDANGPLLAYFWLDSEDIDVIEGGESLEFHLKINRKATMSCVLIPEIDEDGEVTAGLMTIRYEPTKGIISQIFDFLTNLLKILFPRAAVPAVPAGASPHLSYLWLLKPVFLALLFVCALAPRLGVITLYDIEVANEPRTENIELYALPTDGDSGAPEKSGQGAGKVNGNTASSKPPKQPPTQKNTGSPEIPVAVPNIQPRSTSVPNNWEIRVPTNIAAPLGKVRADVSTAPTEKEMKAALLEYRVAMNNLKNNSQGIVFNSRIEIIIGLLALAEDVKKFNCKPADAGKVYLCTYSFTDTSSQKAFAGETSGLKAPQRETWPDQTFPKTVEIRFIKDKESWVVLTATQKDKSVP